MKGRGGGKIHVISMYNFSVKFTWILKEFYLKMYSFTNYETYFTVKFELFCPSGDHGASFPFESSG